jgi:hypothetical protein
VVAPETAPAPTVTIVTPNVPAIIHLGFQLFPIRVSVNPIYQIQSIGSHFAGLTTAVRISVR